MSTTTRNLRQTATYWAPSTPDGFGSRSYSAPVAVNCRWTQKQELFVDSAGKEVLSQAVVWCDTDVALEGYLYLGTSTETDPSTLDGAFEIRQWEKTLSVKARSDRTERKIWL